MRWKNVGGTVCVLEKSEEAPLTRGRSWKFGEGKVASGGG